MYKFVLLLLLVPLVLYAEELPYLIAPTYYDYSNEDSEILKNMSSPERITKADLQKWDALVAALIQKHHYRRKGPYRIYAYLYTAQRDAAFLSYQLHGDFMGSIDQISLKILQLFFPNLTPPFEIKKDPFSEKLAEIVIPRYALRFRTANTTFAERESNFSIFPWTGIYQEFQIPQGATPWLASPLITKMLAPPEDKDFWRMQLEEYKKKQQKKIDWNTLLEGFWVKYEPIHYRDWIMIGNEYVFSHDIPLSKMLLFRSVFAIGLFDVVIGTVTTKNYFGIKRPNIKNNDIGTASAQKPHSYASLHSALAYTAASILTYFFPENKEEWQELANQAAFSNKNE